MKQIVEFYNKLSAQERKFFYGALAAFTIMCMDFLFFQPVSFKLKNLDKEIDQTKSDIKRDVRYLSYQNKIMKEDELYHSFQPDEKKADGEIFGAFMKSLEELAADSSINLGKRSPGDSLQKKGYTLYSANIECTGKLENVVTLIHKINTTNSLLKVVKMTMAGKKASADEVTVAMKVIKLVLDLHTPEEGKATKNDKLIVMNADKILKGIPVEIQEEASHDKTATVGEGNGQGNLAEGGEQSGGGSPGGSATSDGKVAGTSGSVENTTGTPGGQAGTNAGGSGSSGASPTANGSSPNRGQGGGPGSDADAVSDANGGATGQASGGSGSTKNTKNTKNNNKPKALKESDKTQNSKKKKTLTDDLAKGERLTAKKSLAEWWHDFWGGGEDKKKASETPDVPEDKSQPNLLQKLLEKEHGKAENPAEGDE